MDITSGNLNNCTKFSRDMAYFHAEEAWNTTPLGQVGQLIEPIYRLLGFDVDVPPTSRNHPSMQSLIRSTYTVEIVSVLAGTIFSSITHREQETIDRWARLYSALQVIIPVMGSNFLFNVIGASIFWKQKVHFVNEVAATLQPYFLTECNLGGMQLSSYAALVEELEEKYKS